MEASYARNDKAGMSLKLRRLLRNVMAMLLPLVVPSRANTCYDSVPIRCEHNGEMVVTRCHGSASVYPPVWTGVSSGGEMLQFDEQCNSVMTKPERSSPLVPSRESLKWCCGSVVDIQKAPARYGTGRGSGLLALSSSATVIKNLVLLIRFANHKDSPLKPNSAYEQFFNGDTIDKDFNPTGSVKHYYHRQSYGKIILESVVVGWIDVTQTESEAAAGCSSLCSANKLWDAIIEGLDYADSVLDMDTLDQDRDGWLDGLTIIHSGFAAEAGGTDVYGTVREGRIWSHKWGLNKVWQSTKGLKVKANRYNVNPGNFGMSHRVGITRIGVVVHELGHFFGLPDLYDGDSSSSGIHVYGVMSSSWGVDGSQYWPQSISPWCKSKLGWIVPKSLSVGTNTIYPGNDGSDSEIYVVKKNFPSSEAIWIEYRKKHEWDAKLPGGILIWHSDNTVTSGNRKEWYPEIGLPEKHLLVRLIQADGKFKLEKEQWPVRYDPRVFWGEGNELSDFSGDNRITPYAELMKGKKCQTSGNKLFGFKKLLGKDGYSIQYEIQPRVSCAGKEPPRLDFTDGPTATPTKKPTPFPTQLPTTKFPTKYPTVKQTTISPTTRSPTAAPTRDPTTFPTKSPTVKQTTKSPTTRSLTAAPTRDPTKFPTKSPTVKQTTKSPTTRYPTAAPTRDPTKFPTEYPTVKRTTTSPTAFPTDITTKAFPTRRPTSTLYPTSFPAIYSTPFPSKQPTPYPTEFPSSYPTAFPTVSRSYPTRYPVVYPTPFPRPSNVRLGPPRRKMKETIRQPA